ncbi:probable WRKY transcription factor 4 [Beta vulgaris subsp. vulgaris]|uniref:probable WRKY transcription factor 4 n=1 Tax=Beta vulgaris subsp. vulgaris TaxID=3555 RepID=UPI0020372342|nr:probable WRKY transcription factor 4 [Beta vulgaris subsp. vulgaris]
MSDFKDIHKFFGQQQNQQQRPRTTISQKSAPADHSLYTGAPSPSPGSLSNLFSDPFPDNDFRSFSDLLAGAIATHLPATGELNSVSENWGNDNKLGDRRENGNGNGGGSSGFKQNRPGNLVLPPVAPVFNISPGFSPSAFLTSPTFLSPLGLSPQQTLAHFTAQAAISQSHLSIQPDTNPPPSMATYQPSIFNASSRQQLSEHPNLLERRAPSNNFPIAVDKPADDGYNWRKYGQKQVKGSEYPRSYYRCTSPNCPVKKKVERSFDGHITEIIYKGQHNHERPQTGRRPANKDNSGHGLIPGDGFGNAIWSGGVGREFDSAQATSMQLNGPSDSEESGENSQQFGDDYDYNDEPNPKRRNAGAGQSDAAFTHRTVTEPKIVVQTRSDVDLLDDGYRWRKYGQKVVKGNPNPRSYYKCTTVGCKVRKHVERASTDASAVITTYEGKHNHDVPATRGGISAANIQAAQMKLHNNSVGQMNFGSNDQRPITLRLKEEQLLA